MHYAECPILQTWAVRMLLGLSLQCASSTSAILRALSIHQGSECSSRQCSRMTAQDRLRRGAGQATVRVTIESAA